MDIPLLDETIVQENFPNDQRFPTGGTSSVEVPMSQGGMILTAGLGDDQTARTAQMSVYGAAKYSDSANFLGGRKTFVFRGVGLDFGPEGTTYIGNVGVANAPKGGLQQASGPSAAIFLRFNRNTSKLELVRKAGGRSEITESWDFTMKDLPFSRVSMTLDREEWSITAESVHGKTISGSGTFPLALTDSWWQSDQFFIALQSVQNAKNPKRQVKLSVEAISIEGE